MSQEVNRTVTIVGGGFSGVMVATHLLSQTSYPLNIKILEPKPALGRGIAYGTNLSCHLLNVPAGKMSAFTQEPDHFLRWVQQDRPEVTAGSFVPRYLYSSYIQEIFQAAREKSPSRVEWIQEEAIALHREGNQVLIKLQNGDVETSDCVVLALGNFPPSDPIVADPSFYQSSRYFGSFWDNLPRLRAIDPQDRILIIGSGLTMVDVVMALREQKHQGQILVVSRRGLLPQTHKASPASPPFLDAATAPTQVRSLLHLLRQEVRTATAQGNNWRSILDSLRPITSQLWQQLPPAEQKRFLRHLRPYWEYHRHRTAPEIAAAIEQWRESGQLEIHAGRIESYAEDSTQVKVTLGLRGKPTRITLPVQLVINCTGSEGNCRKLQQPLILNLLKTGLIQPDALGLGLKVASTGEIINDQGQPENWLYTLGAPCKGLLWETTAVPELRQQAETLAEILIKTYTR